MYIRRKVFSVLTDEMGEERLYSVNETLFEGYEVDEVDERSFSISAGGAAVSASDIKKAYDAIGGKKSGKTLKEFAAEYLGRVDNKIAKQEAKRAARRAANKANPGKVAAKAGFERGKASATLKDAVVNTWKNSGKLGKAGMIAAPVALVGGAALAGRATKRD